MATMQFLRDVSERELHVNLNEERKGSNTDAMGDDRAHSKETTLGLVLKILRDLSGVQRADLANAIGVGENHLREIEAGRKAATIGNVRKIAKELQVNASVIMFFCEDEELLKSFKASGKVKPLKFRANLLSMLQRMNRS
jgi:transcriptional regulator with XRE-family HTH domain